MKAKTTIIVLSKDSIEILCEALERYKSMLRRCPNHDFDDLTQIHILRNGLQQQSKLLLNATIRGSLMFKSGGYAITIIERMELSDHQGMYNKNPSQTEIRFIKLNIIGEILAHNKLLT